jgi:nuclear protein NHN1
VPKEKTAKKPEEKPANGEKKLEDGEDGSEQELEEGEELEDGEVTDGDEKRPEESEPKPVCRFYTRGQCTWGVSCRFLHPGVTDKGNYNMFDSMVRPVPMPQQQLPMPPFGGPAHFQDYRNDRPPIHHLPPPHHGPPFHGPPGAARPPPGGDNESAWERGLRHAKEMMRKANKRKEQDMDFEDKKMNLSATQEELEKDNYYTRDRASPVESSPPPYGRAPVGAGPYSPPNKFARMAYDDGRSIRYRELPAHRMPHYEDDDLRKRHMGARGSGREVIVQKADEWSDPWSRVPGGGRRSSDRHERRGSRRDRSYSNDSTYSSSRLVFFSVFCFYNFGFWYEIPKIKISNAKKPRNLKILNFRDSITTLSFLLSNSGVLHSSSRSSSSSDSDSSSRSRRRRRYDSHRSKDYEKERGKDRIPRRPARSRSRSESPVTKRRGAYSPGKKFSPFLTV